MTIKKATLIALFGNAAVLAMDFIVFITLYCDSPLLFTVAYHPLLKITRMMAGSCAMVLFMHILYRKQI